MRFSANLTGVFVLYITLPNVQNEDPFKIVLKSLSKGSHMILDRSRNKEHRDLRLSTNLTGVFVLYITLPNVQNEDPFKIVLKSLPKGSHMILDRSMNKEHRDLQLSTNLIGVFVLYITLPNVQNEDPFKIVLKSLPKGSHMILERSINKEHRDLQLSTNLTGVFVLYITLPNVQNEDPFKIVLKSLPKGSHMILERSINKEHRDLQLSTNLTGVFVLYKTLPNVQNEDPFKIVLKTLPKGSHMMGRHTSFSDS